MHEWLCLYFFNLKKGNQYVTFWAGLCVRCNEAPISMRPIPSHTWPYSGSNNPPTWASHIGPVANSNLGYDSDIRYTKAQVARTFTNNVKLRQLEKREKYHFGNLELWQCCLLSDSHKSVIAQIGIIYLDLLNLKKSIQGKNLDNIVLFVLCGGHYLSFVRPYSWSGQTTSNIFWFKENKNHTILIENFNVRNQKKYCNSFVSFCTFCVPKCEYSRYCHTMCSLFFTFIRSAFLNMN